MSIQDIARTDVVTATREASVEDIAREMRDENVGSVVVVEDGKPVGIVTDRDLSVRVLAESHGIELAAEMLIGDLTAEDVMTHGVYTADVDDSLFTVLNEMCSESLRRVPVVKDGELHGIVTLDDFVVLLSTELNNVGSIIAAESPPLEAGAPADD